MHTGSAFQFIAYLGFFASLTLVPLYADSFKPNSEKSVSTVLTQPNEFDKSTLISPQFRSDSHNGFSLLDPNRFSMRQSYSVGFSSGGGASYSSGVYLNTLSYQLANPLILRMDVGMHTPFYSSIPGTGDSRNFSNHLQSASFIMPHIGLEYRPSENSVFSLQWFNGEDAWKAYGPFGPYRTYGPR